MIPGMFLSVMLSVSLDRSTMKVEHPELAFEVPVITGKAQTPTPPGVYLVKRGYSKMLGMRILIFKRDDSGVFAVHPNLKSRTKYLDSIETTDNKLSAGCIGISDKYFNLLWATKQPLVLQVH